MVKQGGSYHSVSYVQDESLSQFTIYIDLNGDGESDEKDCLPEGIELYCITSERSFSCANMLPCDLVDSQANCTFIGGKTAGGACCVDGGLVYGLGDLYQIGGRYHICRFGSEQGEIISNEDGVTPQGNKLLPCKTANEAKKYYDREWLLDQFIRVR